MIAAPSSKIYSLATTITGSIGTISGKICLRSLASEYGIDFDTAGEEHSENATALSPFTELTDKQRNRLNSIIDDIYAHFLAHVALHRGIPPETMQKVARGRVWSGSQALERGLVDAIGGYPAALKALGQLLPACASGYRVVDYPPKTGILALLQDLLASSGEDDALLAPESSWQLLLEGARLLYSVYFALDSMRAFLHEGFPGDAPEARPCIMAPQSVRRLVSSSPSSSTSSTPPWL